MIAAPWVKFWAKNEFPNMQGKNMNSKDEDLKLIYLYFLPPNLSHVRLLPLKHFVALINLLQVLSEQQLSLHPCKVKPTLLSPYYRYSVQKFSYIS